MTFVLLTRVSPEAVRSPATLRELEQRVKAEVGQQCPSVRWLQSFAILGPYDYLDIFEAPDALTAGRVATIVRSFGHAVTETWSAVPWREFKGLLGGGTP